MIRFATTFFVSDRLCLQVLHNGRCSRGQDGDQHRLRQSLASCTGVSLHVLVPNQEILTGQRKTWDGAPSQEDPVESVADFGSYAVTCPFRSSLSPIGLSISRARLCTISTKMWTLAWIERESHVHWPRLSLASQQLLSCCVHFCDSISIQL